MKGKAEQYFMTLVALDLKHLDEVYTTTAFLLHLEDRWELNFKSLHKENKQWKNASDN